MLDKVDISRACPKCGGDAIARWLPAKSARTYYDFDPEWPNEEFMLRICQICGFRWCEACADAD